MHQDSEISGSEGERRREVVEEDSEGIDLQELERSQMETEERGT